MFPVNYIFLLNITYLFAIITCLGFLVIYYINENDLRVNRICEFEKPLIIGHAISLGCFKDIKVVE